MFATVSISSEISSILKSIPGLNIFLLPDAPNFTIVEASDSYIAASHTTREDIIGRGLFEVFPDRPNDPAATIEEDLHFSFLKVIREKVQHELPVKRYDLPSTNGKSLEEHYWLPKNIPIFNDEGNVAYIMHSVTEVTSGVLLEREEKLTKTLLEKTQQHYFSLFQQNPNAVYSFDLEGNFLSANNALADLAECSLDEIYQTSFIPFVEPEDLEKTMFHFGEAAQGKPQRYDVRMITAKGNNRVVNVTNLPIIVDNRIIGVYGIATDITDFVATQEKLLSSHNRFEMVSKASNDAIWDINLVTNEVTRAGKNFYQSLGYSLNEEPLYDFWVSLIHPDDKERILTKFTGYLANPCVLKMEDTYRIKRANGTYAYILDRVIIVRDEQGVATHIYGASKDITSIKQNAAEREILIKELTQSNLDLKQFSYITSHNLRTPIANLISLGSLIDETKIEDSMTRMLLEKYKQTVNKLSENVNDLLEILVVKNNREVVKKEVEINQIFNQVIESVENFVHDSGAEIETDFSAGNLVNFNPGYLHSILLNLLTNAIKYRSPDRKLHIMVNTEILNNQLYLHFTDNGLGIDLKKYGDRVFGLYQKFHDHPESKGLGLHIIASQVKAMGGEINISSTVNQGTTFSIQFKS